jgi:2-phospho-L-lactate guanylyltransferase (CobY/MobA/RfbA family)
LNSAVSKAVQFLEKLGIKRFFTVPGDVPLLDSSELNQLIECVKNSKGVTLVPSHDGLGTNSISSLIPSHITPQFGSNSLSIHHQMVRDIGVPLNVLPLPGLGFDIDGDSRSQRYLSRIDVIQRQSRASKQTTGIEFEQRD